MERMEQLHSFSIKMTRWFLIFALCLPCVGQSWSGVLAVSRGYAWSNAGLPATITYGSGGGACTGGTGGSINCIETNTNAWTHAARTQCGSSLNPSGDTSGGTDPGVITTALSSCKPGSYVLLAAGHWYINSTIYCAPAYNCPAGTGIKGSGAASTTVTMVGGSGGIHIGAGGGTSSCALTVGSNYAAGSATITCPTGTLPSVLDEAWLDQCDDGFTGYPTCTGTPVDTNGVFVCGNLSSGFCQTDSGGGGTPANQEQQVVVTSVNTGTGVIGISPAIIMPNWTHTKGATLTWQGNATAWGNFVEDITVDQVASTNGSAMQFTNSYGSGWIGVRFVGIPPNRAAAVGTHTLNGLFFNNYVYCQNPASLSTSYVNCLEMGSSSGGDTNTLIMNNIIQGGSNVLGGGKESGMVLAYNYAREPSSTLFLCEFQHNPDNDFILREGNDMCGSQDDDTWGTHSFSTWFRNFYNGADIQYYSTSGGNGDPQGVKLDAYARFTNAIGNVIGGPQVTNYVNSAAYVYYFGASDTINRPTSYRWGNVDSVTAGPRWCGIGFPGATSAPCSITSASITSCSEATSTVTCLGSFTSLTTPANGVVCITGTTTYDSCWQYSSISSTQVVFTDFTTGLGSTTSGTIYTGMEAPSTLISPNASYAQTVPSNTNLPCSFFLAGYNSSTSCAGYPSGGTGLSFWKVCKTWTTFPTSCATTQTQPFPFAGPDVTSGPYVSGYAYDNPAAIAFYNLPVDTSYQQSYTIASSSWSNVSGTCSPAPAPCEILTITSAPNVFHLMGAFQLSGVNSACTTGAFFNGNNGANNEIWMTSSNQPSGTTVTYSLASNPGVSCTGTMKFPDVRQFDERVYQADNASTATTPTCSANCAGTYTGSVVVTFANSNGGTTVMCGAISPTTPVTNGSGTGCSTGTNIGTGATANVTISSSETYNVVAGTSLLADSSVLSEAYTINAATTAPSRVMGLLN